MVPGAPLVGTRSRPAASAARRSSSSSRLPSARPSTPTRSGEEACLTNTRESIGSLSVAGSSRLLLPVEVGSIRRAPSAAVMWYNTLLGYVDQHDAFRHRMAGCSRACALMCCADALGRCALPNPSRTERARACDGREVRVSDVLLRCTVRGCEGDVAGQCVGQRRGQWTVSLLRVVYM